MRFIRKNGRIIPIREGKTSEQYKKSANKNMAISSAALVAPIGINKLDESFRSKRPDTDYDFLKNKYKDYVKKSGARNFFVNEANTSESANILTKNVFLHPKSGEATFLHELGHIRASSHNGFNRLGKKVYVSSKMDARKGRKLLSLAKKYSYAALSPVLHLGSEAEASIHAVNEARKAFGNKHAFKIGSQLALPYMGYVAGAAATIYSVKAIYDSYKAQQNKKGRY